MSRILPFEQINEFRLLSVIQDGPYSMSVKAYQSSLNRHVFLKLLKPQVKNHRQWTERFNREAQVCARLKHPHIVDVYTIGEFNGYPYMAMQYVAGLSLRELLEKEQSLSSAMSLEIMHQLFLALGYAHENRVVHRDIKPGNILIDVHSHVSLTDFGLAYLGEDASTTQQGTILGTPAYMSPEQITGEPLTAASDFFAAGATFYEMLSGKKPFAGENYSACIQKILNEIPPPVTRFASGVSTQTNDLIFQLLHKNPAQRPPDAGKILSVIKQQQKNYQGEDGSVQLSGLIKKYYSGEQDENNLPEKSQAMPAGKGHQRISFYRWVISGGIALLILTILAAWQMDYFGRATGEHQTVADNMTPGKKRTPSESENDTPEEATPAQITSSKNAPVHEPGERKAAVNSDLPTNMPTEKSEPPKRIRTPGIGSSLPTTEGPEVSSPERKATSTEKPVMNTPSRLRLEIVPWASVNLNGELVDSLLQNKQISIPPGTHRLTLSHPEFPPKVLEITAKPGEIKNIRYSFLDNAAFLAVEVRPWADVYVDGKYMGTTPLERLIVLNSGRHILELKHPVFQNFQRVLEVHPGDTLQIQKNLSP